MSDQKFTMTLERNPEPRAVIWPAVLPKLENTPPRRDRADASPKR